jgi:hypothetical protein
VLSALAAAGASRRAREIAASSCVKLGDEYMESFCSAGRRESSTWALRLRDMLHDIAEAAAAGRGRQKGRFVADNFSAGILLAGNLCDD